MMVFLRKVWQAWRKVGQFIGDWMARLVLTVFYVVVMLPFGVGTRLFSDPLRMKGTHNEATLWLAREQPTELSLDDARRQF